MPPEVSPARPPMSVEAPTSTGSLTQANSKIKMATSDLDFYYGSFQALHKIRLDIVEKQITALIGPSGCGKSTFLRTLNRMHETVKGTRLEGQILLDDQDILKENVNAVRLKV